MSYLLPNWIKYQAIFLCLFAGGVQSATGTPYRHGRHRQRPRAARRDLMSTIRRRFAPARSYSLEQRNQQQLEQQQQQRNRSRTSVSSLAGALRSASAGRAKSFSELSGAGKAY